MVARHHLTYLINFPLLINLFFYYNKVMANLFWHNLEVEEIEKTLGTDIKKGLNEKDVESYRREFGENKLPEKKPLSNIEILVDQLKSPLIYILLIASAISFVLDELTDAVVILGAVFINVIVGYIQESKASETLREIRKAVKYEAEVLREGNLKSINSVALVPGDIVILKPGDKVPADGRIVENYNLKINEMALTGEWLPTKKKTKTLPKDTPLADRDNMVYMGTIVEDGKGKAVVTNTGINTEIGKISSLIKETKEEKTPYQKKLARFSSMVGAVIAVVCFVIFLEGIATGRDFLEMFITAVAVAVAAIPEGLPVAMTVILALGMRRILERGGLVRKLASAETLGSTSVICTDKTGTLTEGKMQAGKIISASEIFNKRKKGDLLPLKIAFLTSEAFIENPDAPQEEWLIRGRPTDRAITKCGLEKGMRPLLTSTEKIAEIPFNTINKFISILAKEKKNYFIYICGAPEKVIKRSILTKKEIKKVKGVLERLTSRGLRVVASALKKVSLKNGGYLSQEDIEKMTEDMSFAGFVTLKDPVREEAKEAVRVCQQAGMKPIIATGDHKLTAKAVAKELGFKIQKENILEGKELEKLSDKQFEKMLEEIQIYARVEPKHKTRIIQAWQERGEVVAMTGDGINDAPALKKADIGVAVGSGTEVAKETADLILMNDSFSIIVEAVREGRAILDNIRKVITYLLSDSFTEVILIGGSMVICWFLKIPWILPIQAVQILWVNLIEDGLPDLALAFEPKEKDLMKRKPAGHKVPLLTQEMKAIIFIIGLFTDLLLLGLFFWLLSKDKDVAHVQTMIFACLSIDSLFYVFSCKSLKRNIWHINVFSNKLLVVALIVGVLTLLLAVYSPFLQKFLNTTPLSLRDWLIIITLGIMEIISIEITKWYFITRKHDV